VKNILGVVLCGGESKRMGSDKGLKKIEGQTWAQHIAALFIQLNLPYVVSINPQQLKSYSEIFEKEKLVTDSVKIPAALRGVLSVYELYPQKNLLPIACDLIKMTRGVITDIIDAYIKNPGYQFYIYQLTGNTFAEPFAGIYTTSGLHDVDLKYKNDALRVYSFQDIFDSHKTLRLSTPNVEAFSNINIEP